MMHKKIEFATQIILMMFLKKWKNILLKEVDYVYERKIFNITQNNIDGYKYIYILIDIWSKIKKSE